MIERDHRGKCPRALLPTFGVAAVTLLASGCEREGTILPGPAVRDSAGVIIIENPAVPDAPSVWTIGDAPTLEIGRVAGDGPEVFGSIADVIRLGDGEIAVVDGMASQARFFTESGRHTASFGREGGGPGEFSAMSRLLPSRADSLAALDVLTNRVSIFTADGEFARSFLLPGLEDAGPPNLVGRMGEGVFLLTARASPRTPGPRSTILLYAINDIGEVIGLLGGFPDREFGANGLPVGFGGNAVVVAGDSVAWYSHSSRVRLSQIGLDGAVRRIIHLDRPPRAVTADEVAEAQRTVEESLIRQHASEMVMERIMATQFAETHPAHGRVLVDETGHIWVERHQFRPPGGVPDSTESESWDVFDQEGRWRTSLTLPPGFTLRQAGEDFVLGVHSDEMGVERVRIYALARDS